jgi:hypothetical protein
MSNEQKTRLVNVTATMISDLAATVRVPSDVTDDQVLEWYRDNGASGEFIEDGWGAWEWGSASSVETNEVEDGAAIHDLTGEFA